MLDQPPPHARVTSRHFKVVDAQDRLVGNVKHTTLFEAREMCAALVGGEPLGVAEVVERTAVYREVVRR
jgi:hypothetical protein